MSWSRIWMLSNSSCLKKIGTYYRNCMSILAGLCTGNMDMLLRWEFEALLCGDFSFVLTCYAVLKELNAGIQNHGDWPWFSCGFPHSWSQGNWPWRTGGNHCSVKSLSYSLLITNISFMAQVTKVVPAVSEEIKEALIRNIRRRMTPQPLKIRADIEMKCFQFDGVLHIKVQFSSLSFAFILLLWMVLMHMT